MVTYTDEFKQSFWERVDTEGAATCWEWQAGCSSGGYGSVHFNGRQYLTHRVAWQMTHGVQIPDGLVVMHICDNPKCCNPEHLILGTVNDNNQDKIRKGRGSATRGSARHNAKIDEAGVMLMRKMYASGEVSPSALAYIFRLPRNRVYKILRGRDWSWLHFRKLHKPVRNIVVPETKRNVKLSPAIALQLYTERMQGATQRDLAQKYNVSEATVSRVVHGLIWNCAS